MSVDGDSTEIAAGVVEPDALHARAEAGIDRDDTFGAKGGGEKHGFSLADNLETVLTLYNNQLKHGVQLVRDFRDPCRIRGHHDELNKGWTNLIHNALQPMQSRGRLELALAREPTHVVVEITDSGPGMTDGVMGRIFEPFYTTKAQGEGTGLGLSISREIVERHGGTITVQSQPGRTVFTVRLPVDGPVQDAIPVS